MDLFPGNLDRDALLAPVADDAPCGEDLEYDSGFIALIQESAGTPAKVRYELDPETRREVPRVIEKARDPDWNEIFRKTADLLGRSKDTRLAMLLARGGLATGGWAGLAGGVDFLRALLEDQWDGIYPRLDEDDADATLRTNSVSELADEAMLGRVYRTPLVDMPRIGRFSLRDLAVASGEVKPEGDGGAATTEAIAAAFDNAPVDALRGVADSARAIGASIDAIKRVFNDRTDFQFSPNLDGLVRYVRDAITEIDRRLEARGETSADAGAAEETGAEGEADYGDAPVAAVRRGAGPVGQAIASRADVIKTLDAICDWYAVAEPGSPVPMLLRRVRGLVDKSFLDLIRDLAPSGLDQVLVLAGPEAESSG